MRITCRGVALVAAFFSVLHEGSAAEDKPMLMSLEPEDENTDANTDQNTSPSPPPSSDPLPLVEEPPVGASQAQELGPRGGSTGPGGQPLQLVEEPVILASQAQELGPRSGPMGPMARMGPSPSDEPQTLIADPEVLSSEAQKLGPADTGAQPSTAPFTRPAVIVTQPTQDGESGAPDGTSDAEYLFVDVPTTGAEPKDAAVEEEPFDLSEALPSSSGEEKTSEGAGDSSSVQTSALRGIPLPEPSSSVGKTSDEALEEEEIGSPDSTTSSPEAEETETLEDTEPLGAEGTPVESSEKSEPKPEKTDDELPSAPTPAPPKRPPPPKTGATPPSKPKSDDKTSPTPKSEDESKKIYQKKPFIGGVSLALVAIVVLAIIFAVVGKKKSRKNKMKKTVESELGLEATQEVSSKSKSKISTLS